MWVIGPLCQLTSHHLSLYALSVLSTEYRSMSSLHQIFPVAGQIPLAGLEVAGQ